MYMLNPLSAVTDACNMTAYATLVYAHAYFGHVIPFRAIHVFQRLYRNVVAVDEERYLWTTGDTTATRAVLFHHYT